jgi:hypothetical protein
LKDLLRNTGSKLPYHLFVVFLFTAILTVENINGRFWLSDYRVYYDAASAFARGEKIYGVAFGLETGFYKYSPAILLAFIPFTWMPYFAACVIQFIMIAIAAIFAGKSILESVQRVFGLPASSNANGILILGLLCIINHLFRDLHLGNVNTIIVALLAFVFARTLDGKKISAGVAMAICILLKPYLIVLVLPLIFFGRVRVVSSAFITGVIISMLLIPVKGISQTLELHRQWMDAMTAHSEYLQSTNTIRYLCSYYFSVTNNLLPSLILAMLFLGWIFFAGAKGLYHNVHLFFFLCFFGILALLPNILITDTEHFLFLYPLILLCIFLLFRQKRIIPLLIFIFLVVLYGINSPDLLGNRLSSAYEHAGILGIANLGLITFVFYLAADRPVKHIHGR